VVLRCGVIDVHGDHDLATEAAIFPLVAAAARRMEELESDCSFSEARADHDVILKPCTHLCPGQTPGTAVEVELGVHRSRVAHRRNVGREVERSRLSVDRKLPGDRNSAAEAVCAGAGQGERDGRICGDLEEVSGA
jgi:hypothetical protein